MTLKTPAGVSRPAWPLDTGARRIQPPASYTVTRWLRSETMAMTGAPPARDSTASAARSCRLAAVAELPAVIRTAEIATARCTDCRTAGLYFALGKQKVIGIFSD